jgi:tRNA(Met) C34 N-acetyltransferase TmcA
MMLLHHNLLQTGAQPKHSVNGSRGRWHPELEAARATRRLGKRLSSCIWGIAMSFDLLSIAGIASAIASGGFVVLLVAAEDRLEQLVDWR